MTGTVHKVFLSSTFLDQEERRRHIIAAIESFEDMKCVAMERFTATTHPALETCRKGASEADLFIGILAYRYGWIPDGEQKSITELEHDAAHAAGVDRLMFTIDPRKRPMIPEVDADPMPDRWARQQMLDTFKGRLSGTGITARTFSDDTESYVSSSTRCNSGEKGAGSDQPRLHSRRERRSRRTRCATATRSSPSTATCASSASPAASVRQSRGAGSPSP
ncbi:MAG: DUF4062 domain-containing protein [Planctomycetota bacterium]